MTEFFPLPESMQTEYNLLGWILTKNELMNNLSFLFPRHFYSGPHAKIYACMGELHRGGTAITPFTIAPHVSNGDDFKEAGGVVRYLSGSISSSIYTTNPIDDAKVLVEISMKRDLIKTCTTALTLMETTGRTAEENISFLHLELNNISKDGVSLKLITDKQVSQEILEGLKTNKKSYSTGISKLDECMAGGLYSGKSYGIAARKKMGKTSLASTISCNLNISGTKHLFICAEMSAEEVQQRNLARLTDSFTSSFRSSYGQSETFQKKIEHQIAATNSCILYHNAPGLTFDELRSVVSAGVNRGIKGFILDYWQLVGGKPKGKSTAEHLDEVAQWIADYGRKQNLWSLTMAQLNQDDNTRGGEGIRMAFDQVYRLKAPEDDPSRSDRWLEMAETRYTPWMNMGDKSNPSLLMNEKGPYFEEFTKLGQPPLAL